MAIKVSLLISTYNWPEALELVLKSIMMQSRMPDEIIIADDGSGTETKLLIEKYAALIKAPVKHVWHPDEGFRKTIIMNKAIQLSTGNYIVQIDGDIILHPSFIKDHVKHAQPGYFIKGSRGMLSKSLTCELINQGKIAINPFRLGVGSRVNSTHFPLLSSLFYGNPKKTSDLRGCNFAFWKKDFVSVNGYNNDLIGWGHEDIELAARLVNFGIRRKQLKLSAVCFHLYHKINSRKHEDLNYKVYKQVISEKIKVCKNGIDKYL